MKTIGLLGGMSWESSLLYYKIINEGVKEKLGGLHSAKIVMLSVDFEEIELLQHKGEWEKLGEILAKEAQNIERAGAECLLICTNTMHKVAPQIESAIKIPLIHIADATAKALIKDGVKKVGLLGTAFTMEQEFYKSRLQEHGLEVVVPNKQKRELVHSVIYNELCLGECKAASKEAYLEIIDTLAKEGAEGIILGCTEIGMLVKQSDTKIKLYDTTYIHAQSAVEFACKELLLTQNNNYAKINT